jgi:hypothetical protein
MICYRDMTFCPFWENCKNAEDCHRPLTEEVENKAKEWWGKEGAPICVYVKEPNCYEV